VHLEEFLRMRSRRTACRSACGFSMEVGVNRSQLCFTKSRFSVDLVSRSQTKYSVSFLTEGGTTLHIWSDFDGRPEPSLGLSVLQGFA
jgi:hypothetical protein